MKRLTILAMTAFLAVLMSACGEQTDRRNNTTDQSQTTTNDTTRPAGQ